MNKMKDPFGFTKVINMDKLNDPKILKALEKIFLKKDAEIEFYKDCVEQYKEIAKNKINRKV